MANLQKFHRKLTQELRVNTPFNPHLEFYHTKLKYFVASDALRRTQSFCNHEAVALSDIRPKLISNSNREKLLVSKTHLNRQNFALITAAILPWSVQNLKKIWQQVWYPISQQPLCICQEWPGGHATSDNASILNAKDETIHLVQQFSPCLENPINMKLLFVCVMKYSKWD